MGKVFKAKFASTNVAVKVFENTDKNNAVQDKFFEEAEIQYKLRSTYIVLFMGVCIELNQYMLITELMDMTLFELIHEKKIKLNFRKKLKILKAIANGMDYLHHENVIHCDLKSSNILLNND
jgi:serine/threonine protein kinase